MWDHTWVARAKEIERGFVCGVSLLQTFLLLSTFYSANDIRCLSYLHAVPDGRHDINIPVVISCIWVYNEKWELSRMEWTFPWLMNRFHLLVYLGFDNQLPPSCF